jgi:hypothetical protein
MENKMLVKLSKWFSFLAVAFVILFSSFIGKAQDASTKCEWVKKWVDEMRVVNGGITYEKVYKDVYECSPNNNVASSSSNKEQTVSASKAPIEGGEFSAPADSPIIGTWKQIEYKTIELPKIINGTVVMEKTRQPSGKTMTFIFSQNGVVEIISNQGLLELGKGKFNWIYTSTTKTSGSLKIFLEKNVITEGKVSFLNKNKLELVGTQDIWIKE